MVNYISKIVTQESDPVEIGGDNFDGQWVYCSRTINSSFTLETKASLTLSLSSLLPNDGFDYECLFRTFVVASATSGEAAVIILYSGSSTASPSAYQRVDRLINRAANAQQGGGTAFLPIYASDKNVTVYNDSSQTTGSCSIYLHAYRRVGKNGSANQYISKINTKGSVATVGGDNFNGPWVYSNSTLISSVNIASNASTTVDFSNYLPNDNYTYEILIAVTSQTGAAAGNIATLRLGETTKTGLISLICRRKTQHAVYTLTAGNLLYSTKKRSAYLFNTGNVAATGVNLYARGYRRIGKNMQADMEVTLTITTIPSSATVDFYSMGAISGKKTVVMKGTQVPYKVSASGYTDVDTTITVNSNTNKTVSLVEQPYDIDEVVFESSTARTYSVDLAANGKYEVICIAGGGGGKQYRISDKRYDYGGGSGSGFDCVLQLTSGTYNIVVGSAGSKNSYQTSKAQAGSGGNSQFGTSYTYGGGGGKYNAVGPKGAAPSITYTIVSTTFNKAGNNGTSDINSTAAGGASVYDNTATGYGAGGRSNQNGYAGYVKIIYKGT